MTSELAGQVAIITGAGQGLGRAMALALVRAGCHVLTADIRESSLAEVSRSARERGDGERLATAVADIGDLAACRRLVDDATRQFGAPSIVINNAVLGPDSIHRDFHVRPVRFWEVDPDLLVRHFLVNTIGPYALIHAAVPKMLERGYGRIINLSTSLATMLLRGYLPYGGTKAAIEALTVMIAKDLDGTGITANVLIPGGPAATPAHMGPLPEGWDREKLLSPEIMGPPVVWLASPASSGVTAKRIIAALWDSSLPGEEAVRNASSDAGWAVQPVALPT